MKTMIFRVTAVLIFSIGCLLVLDKTSANQIGDEIKIDGESKAQVVFQDEKAAREADVNLIAKESGYSPETVENSLAFQEAFSAYADEILTRYPNQVSAVWVERMPAVKGHIRFVDEIPSDVGADLFANDKLNPNSFELTGNGKISIEDHARRARLASFALADLGYTNTVTFYDPVKQVIRLELKIPDGFSQPNKLDIAGAIRELLQADRDQFQGTAAMLEPDDLDLRVITGTDPIVELAHTRGGTWLRDDGVRECTGGFTVSGPNGDGIITAGHCNGLNQFEEPGVAPYAMTWRSQVFDLEGDVEYHTTSHVEYDDFYSDAATIRDVTGIKTTNTMTGSVTCVYGRSSNARTCNIEVEAVDVTVNANGTLVGSLARARSAAGFQVIAGDSGGGWSVGNTAWGITHGYSPSDDEVSYFTPVQEAQTALGVTIKQ